MIGWVRSRDRHNVAASAPERPPTPSYAPRTIEPPIEPTDEQRAEQVEREKFLTRVFGEQP